MIEVPVLYRWYGIKNMSMELGMQGAYLINSTERNNAGEIAGRAPLRQAEWSAVGGLSYYFLKGKIEVNARYSNSILTMKKNDWWMNHVVGFSVRYWFRTTLDRDKLEATKKKNRIQVKVDTGDKIDE
jgi:hypothetical protein